MSRFIESIQLKDGALINLHLHEQRIERTIESHYGRKGPIELAAIKTQVKNYPLGIYKCRLVYTQKLEEVSIQPYRIRPINSLQVVNSQLDYSLKYEDRSALNKLFAQRGDCDDVIIVKDGIVTDGSYTNLAFYDGKYWWTPTNPLFQGVQRKALLAERIIRKKVILEEDIYLYKKVKLFNAMMDWENAPEVGVERILKMERK